MLISIPHELIEKIQSLPKREYQVFLLYGAGKTTNEISRIPGNFCSTKTIDTFRAKTKNILGLKTMDEYRRLAFSFHLWLKENNLTGERTKIERAVKYQFLNTNASA